MTVSWPKIDEQGGPEATIELTPGVSDSAERYEAQRSLSVVSFRLPRCHCPFGKTAGQRSLYDAISAQHRIQGIGAGFVPALLDRALSRQVQKPHDEDAPVMAR